METPNELTKRPTELILLSRLCGFFLSDPVMKPDLDQGPPFNPDCLPYGIDFFH
jgi:hypothetical protein